MAQGPYHVGRRKGIGRAGSNEPGSRRGHCTAKGFSPVAAHLVAFARAIKEKRLRLVVRPAGSDEERAGRLALRGAVCSGFSRPAARELNPWFQTERVISRQQHRVDRYLELLKPLGVVAPKVDFGLHLPPSAGSAVEQLMRRPELQAGFAVLNPCGLDRTLAGRARCRRGPPFGPARTEKRRHLGRLA